MLSEKQKILFAIFVSLFVYLSLCFISFDIAFGFGIGYCFIVYTKIGTNLFNKLCKKFFNINIIYDEI